MRVRITAACIVIGLLCVHPHLRAGEQDPILRALPATPSTQPTTRPAWLPDDLQQRRQAAKARHEQELAALQKALLDGYAASGHADPKWDDSARKAIRAFALGRIPELNAGSAAFEAHRASFDADRAGCRDSLIQYILARMAHWVIRPTPADDTRQIEAGLQLQQSQYPDVYKAYGALRTMQFLAMDTVETGKSHEKEIADAHAHVLNLAQRIAKGPPIPRYELVNLLQAAGEVSAIANHDTMRLPAELLTALNDGYPDRNSLSTAEGVAWAAYAWDAYTASSSSTATDPNWRQFEDRLNRAQKLLTSAWDLDHDNALAARHMLTVCKGLGHPRPIMEQWFKAVVAADPDSASAYDEKLEYLEPRWSGSPEEMIEFGRECLTYLPDDCARRLTIVSAYLRLARYESTKLAIAPARAYFANSSDRIWPDIQAAFEPYGKAHDLSDYHRFQYARLALWCNQHDKARELLRDYIRLPGRSRINSSEIDAMREELGLPDTAPATK